MKNLILYLTFLANLFYSYSLYADGFPEDYLNQQIHESKKYIDVDLDKLKREEFMVINYVGRPI